MFKKLFKAGYTSVEITLRIIYFILGAILITWISYLFGHVILDGQYNGAGTALIGNDSTFAISLVYWFSKFYPKIPIWYTVQGMGVSLFYSYPIWTTFVNIFIKNLTGMGAVEVYRILSFTSFPLTAIGIYVFAWARTKKQTVGLLGGLFFLLSQASWLFQSLHGIFAQSFSFIFVAPSILFFDLFLETVLKGEAKKTVSRVYFVLAVLSLGITFLMHFVTGVMVTITLLIWSVLWFIFSEDGKLKFVDLVKKTVNGLLIAGVVIVLGYGLGAFWLMPFNHYTNIANIGGFNTRSLEALQQESLRIPSLLGFSMLGAGEYRYDFFFFAGSVLVFFAIGSILSVIKKEKFVMIASLVSLFFIFLTTVPIYLPFVASSFKFFFTGVYFRGIIPALILLPIVAAWGVWATTSIVLIPLKSVKIKPVHDLAGIIVSTLMLIISFVIVANFKPSPPPNPEFSKSYKYQFQPYGPSLSDDFNQFLAKPYLPKKFPEITINKQGLEGKTLLNDALSKYFPEGSTTIFDVSPFAAGGAILQGSGILNNSRFVNLYHYYASLIHGMWGYQAGEFYGKDKLYVSAKPLSDLSDWFGIKYTVLTPGFDPFNKYLDAGWTPNEEFNAYAKSSDPATGKDNWGIEVWQSPKATGLISLTSRPAVLVIGDEKLNAYDNVFRSGNLGALGYNDALITQGSKNIDDYSLSDLKEFGGIILNGYSYKSKSGAWNLIKKYLDAGGKVFVDTGWQYIDADWAGVGLPDVFPVVRTQWKDIGSDWGGIATAFSSPDFSKFDKLSYKGGAWNMAVAQRSDLKNGAEALITKGDAVLMASQKVGKGEIVWSGMNIFSQIALTMNDAPAGMLGEVLRPLFTDRNSENYSGASYARPFPDTATLTFTNKIDKPSWLLFREANSPYASVKLTQGVKVGSPKIFKAGPGFILVRLPAVNSGDKITIEEKLNFIDGFLAKALSILSAIFLITYLFIGDKVVMILNNLPYKKMLKNKYTANFASSFKEDENDY